MSVDEYWKEIRHAKSPVISRGDITGLYDIDGMRNQVLTEVPQSNTCRYIHNKGFIFKGEYTPNSEIELDSTFQLPKGEVIVRLSYASVVESVNIIGTGIRFFKGENEFKDMLFIGPNINVSRDDFSLLYKTDIVTGVVASVVSSMTPFFD
jgi:hypothetical protein